MVITRMFIAIVAVGLLAAACGGGAGAPAATPDSGSAAKASPSAPATRLVRHAAGDTVVPAEPKRVAVLDMGELDMVLALDVVPVGYATYTLGQPLPSYLQGRGTGMKSVGLVTQPNLETLVALKPDLIISNKTRHDKIYDKLSQIAPTVLTERVGAGWREAFKVVGDALGKSEQEEQLMGRYRQRLADFRTQMGSRLQQTKVSLVRSFPDRVRIYMKDSFMGTIVQDAGLPRPAAQDKDKFAEEATVERIPDLDGDVMFVMYFDRAKGERLSPLTQSPLWVQLGAVKAKRVYEVDDETWGTGLGPIAADRVVNDLFRYLVAGAAGP